jgi:hypothetical protein
MKIRTIFGYLFFLLSVIFCAIQRITLPASERLEATPLLLQFSSAVVCLLLGSLAVQSDNKTATITISVIAFSVCFLALVTAGVLAMKGSGAMAPIKYVVFLAYAGLFGLFGLAFSFLAGKSEAVKPTKDA